MNITKKIKTKPEKSFQAKPSYLIISTNFQLEKLYQILKKNPNLVNIKEQKGETFLSYELKRKNIDKAELILTSPVLDYKFQDINGNSYLHLGVINQLENIAKTLIEKGINVNMQNNQGNTALHFAYSTGNNNLIKLLINGKADINIKNNDGKICKDINNGTFPEILDVSYNYIKKENMNKNNLSDNNDKNEIKDNNLNSDNKIANNNDIIMNDKGQLNKSIKINWENNNFNNNDDLNNIATTSNNINKNPPESQQSSKLKFSLVNFSYSDEEDENKDSKINVDIKSSKNDTNNNKNNMQSSDIFDLVSSTTYKEKLTNINNHHTVEEPKNILLKKESAESNNNTEDLVNINTNIMQTSNDNKISLINSNSININNLVQNGIQLSQASFQTSYENGRKIIISKNTSNDNGLNIKSENDIINNKYNDNISKGNGLKRILDFNKSLKKEEIFQNPILNKKESEPVSNYDNDNENKSNIFQSKIDNNENFNFSPFVSLKKTVNNQINGSEINIDNINNININNEIENQKSLIIKTDPQDNNKNNNINENNNDIISQKSEEIHQLNSANIIPNKFLINKNDNPNNINIVKSEANINNGITKKFNKLNLDCPINSSQETSISSPIKKPQDSLYKFLSEIRLETYYSILNSNGFDDIPLLINQTKTGTAITDKQLKISGINIPGDRAKILLKLQEKAGNFGFPVPKEVYYICQNENYEDDININKLKEWLEGLKVEIYFDNFIKNGYHSLELMLLQMESKNPITDDILKDEIGINKIGHRSRIINKLTEEGRSKYNKWKSSVLILGADFTKKICDCKIF